jgi:energy-converting hydrogenase Eha subunit C
MLTIFQTSMYQKVINYINQNNFLFNISYSMLQKYLHFLDIHANVSLFNICTIMKCVGVYFVFIYKEIHTSSFFTYKFIHISRSIMFPISSTVDSGYPPRCSEVLVVLRNKGFLLEILHFFITTNR